MNVVMIDRGQVTDRRIILEANALQRVGHEVVLIACRSSTGAGPASIDGVPVTWIPGYERIGPPRSKHVQQPFRNALMRSTARLDAATPWLRENISNKALRLIVAFLLCPYAGIHCLATKPFTSWKIRLFAFVLALATLNPFFLARFLKRGYRKVFQEDPRPATAAAAQELEPQDPDALDEWETRVVEHVAKMPKVDVVHAHDLPALKPAVEIKKRLGVTLIHDAHELYTYQVQVYDPVLREATFNEEKRLLAHADRVIVINENQAEIMRFDFEIDAFTVVTNAAEIPPGFDHTRRYDIIREKTGIPADAKILLFQGGINHMRCHHLLLDGIAMAREDVHMVFLTWGQEIFEFREMAKNLGIGDRVHFLPAVPWNEVIYWAASCDAGIMPYQPVTMNALICSPNKMFEFIAACTPMIASSGLANVGQVIESEGFGVARNLRIGEDYALAINEMFDESLGGVDRFKDNLRKRRDHYLWDHEQTKLLDLYARIAAGPKPSSRPTRVLAKAG